MSVNYTIQVDDQDLHKLAESQFLITNENISSKKKLRPALHEPKHQKQRNEEFSMNQVRKREMSANPEYSIKYKVLIRAHQDLILERSKKHIQPFYPPQPIVDMSVQQVPRKSVLVPQKKPDNSKPETVEAENKDRSMTYLKNAFSHINIEERTNSRKLTSVQKNRIALKYVRFRENQMAKIAQERNLIKTKKPLVEVTGGYDTMIERYGESKGSKKKAFKSNNDEQNKIQQIVNATTDYIADGKYIEPDRATEFIRGSTAEINSRNPFQEQRTKKNLMQFGGNPYALSHERQKSISRVKSAPRYNNALQNPESSNVALNNLRRSQETEKGLPQLLSARNQKTSSSFVRFQINNEEQNSSIGQINAQNNQQTAFIAPGRILLNELNSKSIKFGNPQDQSRNRRTPLLLKHSNKTNRSQNIKNQFYQTSTSNHNSFFKSTQSANYLLDSIKGKCDQALDEPSSNTFFKNVQSNVLQGSQSPTLQDLYQPNHPYLASMAIRNIQKIDQVGRHFRKFQQLVKEEESKQSRDTLVRQSKTSQGSVRQHDQNHERDQNSYEIVQNSLPNKIKILGTQNNQSKIKNQATNAQGHIDMSLLFNLKQYLRDLNKVEDLTEGPFLDYGNNYMTKEQLLDKKLDATIKRIDQFQQDQSFNKITLREITQKQNDLKQRRNHRIKNAKDNQMNQMMLMGS